MRADVEAGSRRRLEEAGRSGRPVLLVVSGTSRLDRTVLRKAVRPHAGDVDVLGLHHSRRRAERAAARRLARYETPPVVLPAIVVWSRAARRPPRGIWARLLGSPEHPTALRRLVDRLLHGWHVFVQVGPATATISADGPTGDDERHAVRRRVAAWRRALRDERRVVAGPPVPHARPFFDAIEGHPRSREAVARVAEEEGVAEATVARRFRRELERTSSRYLHEVVVFLYWLLRVLWTRIYRGVDVREEDVERIRQAIRDGSAVLVPSHRSHLDYLLLSWLLFVHRVVVPHIVAGRNMDLPVAGRVLRGAGAFFIERSFRDDPVFAAVFDRYVRELVRRGFLLEYFIEGGRSRTGRMLPARHGVLSRVVAAAAGRRPHQAVTLVPLAFSFEKVAEARTYARELRGVPKVRESWRALLKATSRLLREDHGRVVLRVGEPLDVGPHIETTSWGALPEDERRRRVAELGDELRHRIGQAQVAMAVHVVALTVQSSAGGTFDVERFRRWRSALRVAGAFLAPELEDGDVGADDAIGVATTALEQLRRRGLLTRHDGRRQDEGWRAATPEARVELELLSNHALHTVATASLLAWCVVPGHPLPSSPPPLFVALRRLARDEIGPPMHRADFEVWDEARRVALAFGIGDPVSSDRRDALGEVLRPLVEAAWLVLARGGPILAGRDGARSRDLVARLQEAGREDRAAGRLRRDESLLSTYLQHLLDATVADGLFEDGRGGELRDALADRLA